jgi:7-cyano-7-deazaguanine synthase
MCGVYGAIVAEPTDKVRATMRTTFDLLRERGRTSWGVEVTNAAGTSARAGSLGVDVPEQVWAELVTQPCDVVANRRAETTTHWVGDKTDADIPPFRSPSGEWAVSFNGVIANDDRLRAELGIHDAPTPIDAWTIGAVLDALGWDEGIRRLEGSIAIVAANRSHPGRLWVACNYQPLYVRGAPEQRLLEVASQATYLDHGSLADRLVRPAAFQIPPYSIGWVELEDLSLESLYPPIPPEEDKVLAICSSGMDSTTAAAYHLRRGQQVTLLHFDIGQRAAEREQEAVHQIAEALGVPVKVITTDLWTQFHSRSTLIDRTRPVHTGHYGQDGAELHHDWVEFRNTLLLAMASGYADAQGFHTLCLGTNLAESQNYADNVEELPRRFGELLPWGMRPYHQVVVSRPVGTLMKPEIIQLGDELSVPWERTYSCYVGRRQHCGVCPSCYNRRLAFAQAGRPDPTEYEVVPTVEPLAALPR